MTPDDLTSRAQGEAEDAARKFVHERHPQWHDVGVGIVQGSHYRAGFAAGAKWWEQNRPVAVPRHGEALTADYNQGPRDAMRTAKESVGTYLGYPSANSVLGFGPDAVIVDGDWLVAHLADPDALGRAKAEALREAADAWQTGGWAESVPASGGRPALLIGMAQRATDWLRARADRIDPDRAALDPEEPR